MTVINAGVIGTGSEIGVRSARGSVTNSTQGTITGSVDGIKIAFGPTATVSNFGHISGGTAGNEAGVYIRYGGQAVNSVGGTITGYDGVLDRYGALNVTNGGSISGYFAGVDLVAGGSSSIWPGPRSRGASARSWSAITRRSSMPAPLPQRLRGWGRRWTSPAATTVRFSIRAPS